MRFGRDEHDENFYRTYFRLLSEKVPESAAYLEYHAGDNDAVQMVTDYVRTHLIGGRVLLNYIHARYLLPWLLPALAVLCSALLCSVVYSRQWTARPLWMLWTGFSAQIALTAMLMWTLALCSLLVTEVCNSRIVSIAYGICIVPNVWLNRVVTASHGGCGGNLNEMPS